MYKFPSPFPADVTAYVPDLANIGSVVFEKNSMYNRRHTTTGSDEIAIYHHSDLIDPGLCVRKKFANKNTPKN